MPTVDVVPATGHVPPDGNAGNGVTAPSGATCTTSFASASETSALPLGSIATASAVWPKEKSNAARICGLLTGAVAAPADAPVISVRVAAAAVTREILIGRCLIRALPLIPGNRGSGYQLNERYASHSVSTPGQSLYRSKMRWWCLTWGSLSCSRGPVVLVDHAAEYLAALYRRAERRNDRLVMAGWPLVPGLVRPVPVVMPGIGLQHGPQVALAVDQHPVRALSPHGPYPPLRITVRPRRPRRGLHGSNALAGKDSIERRSELGVAVPDEEAKRADPVPDIYQQVAGLLSGPCPVRVGGHPQDVHTPGRHLHDEQHIQAPEQDRVDREEITRQQALSLGAQERPPGGIHAAGSRPAPASPQDPADGRLADMMAETGQLAVDPAVSPGRVLTCQPQHQVADLLARSRPARRARVGPSAGEETAMPRQPGSRRNQPAATQCGRKQPSQCRQDGPVGPVRPRAGDLTAEHHHLVTQDHDLH